MRFVDLSHVITEGLTTYPGLPAPHIFDHLDRVAGEAFYGPGVTFTIGMVTICSNTRTYIDMPFHRLADGHDLTGLPLERVADVPGVCIDCCGISAAQDRGSRDLHRPSLRGPLTAVTAPGRTP